MDVFMHAGNVQCMLHNFLFKKSSNKRNTRAMIFVGQPRALDKIIPQLKFFQKFFTVYITVEKRELEYVMGIINENALNLHVIEINSLGMLTEKVGLGVLQFSKYKYAMEHISKFCNEKDTCFEYVLKHRTDYYLWFPLLLPYSINSWDKNSLYCNGDQCFGGGWKTMNKLVKISDFSLRHAPWVPIKAFDIDVNQILRSDDVFCWWFINVPSCFLQGTRRLFYLSSIRKKFKTIDRRLEVSKFPDIAIPKRSKGFPSQKVFALFLNGTGIVARFSVLWFGTLRYNRK